MSIQDKVNSAGNTVDQQGSDLQSAANGDPTGVANATTDLFNGFGGLVGGKTGMDAQQAAGPAGQAAGAGVGVIDGDPSGASALASEGYQKLGEGIGGDVGGLIQEWSPGLGEATGNGLTIGVGLLTGNSAAVDRGVSGLTALEGDVGSSATDWLGHKVLGGQLGAGVSDTGHAIDDGTQVIGLGGKLLSDIQQGDGLATAQDGAATLHHVGDTLNSAGQAVQHLTNAVGLGSVGSIVAGGLEDLGGAVNSIASVGDKGSATIGAVTGLAGVPQQVIGGLTTDAIKTAGQVASDAWNGVENAASDLYHGNVGAAAGDLGSAAVQGVGDLANGVGNAAKETWNMATGAVSDAWNAVTGLFGGGGGGTQKSEFDDSPPSPSTLPPGVHDAYLSTDSDGNLILSEVADNGNTVVMDPTTSCWTQIDGNGNVLLTYRYDPSISCWTATDPNGNVLVHDGSGNWVPEAGPTDVQDFGGLGAPPPPPPPAPQDPAILYGTSHHANVGTQAVLESPTLSTIIHTGSAPAAAVAAISASGLDTIPIQTSPVTNLRDAFIGDGAGHAGTASDALNFATQTVLNDGSNGIADVVSRAPHVVAGVLDGLQSLNIGAASAGAVASVGNAVAQGIGDVATAVAGTHGASVLSWSTNLTPANADAHSDTVSSPFGGGSGATNGAFGLVSHPAVSDVLGHAVAAGIAAVGNSVSQGPSVMSWSMNLTPAKDEGHTAISSPFGGGSGTGNAAFVAGTSHPQTGTLYMSPGDTPTVPDANLPLFHQGSEGSTHQVNIDPNSSSVPAALHDTSQGSDTAHVPGLGQSFWAEAAASSELAASTGSSAPITMDLGNSVPGGGDHAGHAANQINLAGAQFTTDHVDAGQHVDVAAPAHTADQGAAPVMIDVTQHVHDFFHQMHI